MRGILAGTTSPNNLVVASPGGGVWTTSTGGTTWSPSAQPWQYGGLGDYSVTDLQYDQINVSTIYASTMSDLYSSADFGVHWTNLTQTGGSPAPLMMAGHVADPKLLTQLKFSATQRAIIWAKPCEGLTYSLDGTTFTQTYPFAGTSTNLDNCIQAMAADPTTGYVYISTLGGGPGTTDPPHVFRSCGWTETGACLTWTSVNTGFPVGTGVRGLAYTGFSNNLVAIDYASGPSSAYVTSDGTTWHPTASQPATNNATVVAYPGADQIFWGATVFAETTNYGGSWTDPSPSMMHPDVRSIYWDNSLGYLWAATDGTNSGAYGNIIRWNWSLGSAASTAVTIPVTGANGLPVLQAYAQGVVDTATGGRRSFIVSQDNGGFCRDGGAYGDVGAPPGHGSGDIISIAIAPSNHDRVYVRNTGLVALAVSDNARSATSCGGVIWTAIYATPTNVLQSPAVWTNASMTVHPTNPDALYLASGYSQIAYRTTATSAFTLSSPLPGSPVCVAVDSASTIYVGTVQHGAYYSTDNGATWNEWGLNTSSPVAIMNIVYSSASGGTWFMATTSGLYRKVGTSAWALVTGGGGYIVSDVAVDPNCPTRVYAGLGFGFVYGQHRGGIQVSSSNGNAGTWTSLTSGLALHQSPIADVQADPLDSRYVWAGSYGLGGWYYDSGATPSCP